ncbi:MAG TPA: DUF3179 domain-containing protein [Actinomycetota bacterium]
MGPSFRGFLAASGAAALLLAACTGGEAPTPATSPGTGSGPPVTPDAAPADLTQLTREDLTRVLSPDSIPSIDEPRFVAPDEAEEWLSAQEPVAVLEIDGDARAYPHQIMTWHEIVNDVVGGTPVAVTYCPLCNSALAYPRKVGTRVLEFGTSGSLYNSALVMYDRQTESLWLHFEGLAIEGPLEGTHLELIPVQTLSFEQFRGEHPGGRVLSQDTGFNRPYGQNPYDFYDTAERPFLFDGEVDARLPAIARVVGVEIDEEAVAYPYEALSSEEGASVVHDTVGGEDLVVFWKAGVRSALDNPEIELGRDVGSSGVFLRQLGGRELSFLVEGDRVVDEQTGSVWSLAGRATGGPLEGQELTPVQHLDTFWFAWSSHNRETRIFEG